MNTSLNKQLYSLLNNTGLTERKANLVFGFSHGRSESSKDLTDGEAIDLINYLRNQPNAEGKKHKADDPANKMRRKIISMAHEMGWHSLANGKWKPDMKRLDAWCVKSSYLKKELNKYSYHELPLLVSQFTKVYKSYLNKF